MSRQLDTKVPIKPASPTARPTGTSAPSSPYTINVKCLYSKTYTFSNGSHGLGCRETPPAVWTATGCPQNIGCCNNSAGCLVAGTKGDGIY